MLDWSKWPNFREEEFRCKDGATLPESTAISLFLDRLQRLRVVLNFPFTISSAYRTPTYNAQVSNTGLKGPHTTGRAVDLLVHGDKALSLVAAAPSFGFTGVGVKQSGPISGRFIHLDDLLPLEANDPRPWLWSYG